ncbi:MAG: hypothetical protein WC438_05710 [Candidatus Pacearchaeota archaeon]|jgi:hypothetical protein
MKDNMLEVGDIVVGCNSVTDMIYKYKIERVTKTQAITEIGKFKRQVHNSYGEICVCTVSRDPWPRNYYFLLTPEKEKEVQEGINKNILISKYTKLEKNIKIKQYTNEDIELLVNTMQTIIDKYKEGKQNE